MKLYACESLCRPYPASQAQILQHGTGQCHNSKLQLHLQQHLMWIAYHQRSIHSVLNAGLRLPPGQDITLRSLFEVGLYPGEHISCLPAPGPSQSIAGAFCIPTMQLLQTLQCIAAAAWNCTSYTSKARPGTGHDSILLHEYLHHAAMRLMVTAACILAKMACFFGFHFPR